MAPESTKAITAQLWHEAFTALKADPDDRHVIEDFRKSIEKPGVKLPGLSNPASRDQLLAIIAQHNSQLQQSKNTLQPILHIANKLSTLVKAGAAPNPVATAAVAGLFVAFDLLRMHRLEKEAIFTITIRTAEAVALSDNEVHMINPLNSHEPQELSTVRQHLRATFVQLYRTIIYLSMRIAYKLTKHRHLIVFTDWQGGLTLLKECQEKTTRHLDSIHRRLTNPPAISGQVIPISPANLLKKAAELGYPSEIWRITQSLRCDASTLNTRTKVKRRTPLMLAVLNDHHHIIQMLLDRDLLKRGLDITLQDTDGMDALHLAANRGKTSMVKLLLDRGAKDTKNGLGRTGFMDAAKPGHLEVMKELFLSGGMDLNQTTEKNGWTALHSAVGGNQAEVVRWLVGVGVERERRITGGKRKGMTARDLAFSLDGTCDEILAVLAS